jgi:hypothetical protein
LYLEYKGKCENVSVNNVVQTIILFLSKLYYEKHLLTKLHLNVTVNKISMKFKSGHRKWFVFNIQNIHFCREQKYHYDPELQISVEIDVTRACTNLSIVHWLFKTGRSNVIGTSRTIRTNT